MSHSPVIDLDNIHVSFAHKQVLSGVSLKVQAGELVMIEGATGAGKTTLVRVLVGAQPLQAGSAQVLETDLSHAPMPALMSLRRRIGIVFQTPRFLERENVLWNAALPLAIQGAPSRRCRGEGTRALMDAGLLSNVRKRPRQLSGGEQARLQIARALIHNPFLLLADEPFAHLDPDSAAEAEDLIARAHARGTTVLITTHRPTALAAHAVRYRMENGQLIRGEQHG